MIAAMLLTSVLGLSSTGAGQAPETPPLVTSEIVLAGSSGTLALRDLDGDGRLDLFDVEAAGIRVFFQAPDGTFGAESDLDLEWPAGDLGWDLVDYEGDGRYELALIEGAAHEGGRIRLARFSRDGVVFEDPILTATRAFLPAGLRRMRCLRDVDGDGVIDVVVPATGRYRLFLGKPRSNATDVDETGAAAPAPRFGSPIEIAFDAEITLQVGDPDELESTFSQEVRLPWFEVRDVDGDGDLDLVAETEDDVRFYLADPELPEQPTWRLDLAARRAQLGRKDGINLDDLLSNVAPTVTWRVVDLDGSAPHELILQEGSTLKLWRGGSRGALERPPDQVLRASGTILWTFLRDVDRDGDQDLQIVRSEALTLARVVRWLVLPGSFDIDLYTYDNEGGLFGRKPAKKTTLAIQIPRLLSIEEKVESIGEAAEQREAIPAEALDYDGDGYADDVVDVREGKLVFLRNVLAEGETVPDVDLASTGVESLLDRFLLSDLDGLPDGGRKEFGIDDLGRWRLSAGSLLRDRSGDRTPDRSMELGIELEALELFVVDLDRDGRSEVVLIGRDEDGRTHLRTYDWTR